MTIAAVAVELGCHPETVRRAIRSGHLACYRMGGITRVSSEQLATYLDRCLRPARATEDEHSANTEEALRRFRFSLRVRKALNPKD
jgi:excisionase family DNA binding protein